MNTTNYFRIVKMLVDENKNIVIFPLSKVNKNDDDATADYGEAYFPIELMSPYTVEELAKKIEEGFNEWNKHKCYPEWEGKNTFEEKYYGIKGFKNAVKGKKFLSLHLDNYFGNEVSLMLPMKRGYAYLRIKSICLDDEAECIDFAKAVISLIDLDLETISAYKSQRSKFNI